MTAPDPSLCGAQPGLLWTGQRQRKDCSLPVWDPSGRSKARNDIRQIIFLAVKHPLAEHALFCPDLSLRMIHLQHLHASNQALQIRPRIYKNRSWKNLGFQKYKSFKNYIAGTSLVSGSFSEQELELELGAREDLGEDSSLSNS